MDIPFWVLEFSDIWQYLVSDSTSLSYYMLFFSQDAKLFHGEVNWVSEEKSEFDSNYHQLMLLHVEDDPSVADWMEEW